MESSELRTLETHPHLLLIIAAPGVTDGEDGRAHRSGLSRLDSEVSPPTYVESRSAESDGGSPPGDNTFADASGSLAMKGGRAAWWTTIKRALRPSMAYATVFLRQAHPPRSVWPSMASSSAPPPRSLRSSLPPRPLRPGSAVHLAPPGWRPDRWVSAGATWRPPAPAPPHPCGSAPWPAARPSMAWRPPAKGRSADVTWPPTQRGGRQPSTNFPPRLDFEPPFCRLKPAVKIGPYTPSGGRNRKKRPTLTGGIAEKGPRSPLVALPRSRPIWSAGSGRWRTSTLHGGRFFGGQASGSRRPTLPRAAPFSSIPHRRGSAWPKLKLWPARVKRRHPKR